MSHRAGLSVLHATGKAAQDVLLRAVKMEPKENDTAGEAESEVLIRTTLREQ